MATKGSGHITAYIEHRIAGLEPRDAALAAGYVQSGLRVAICRLEQREDVRVAIRVAKRGGKTKLTPKVVHGQRQSIQTPDDLDDADSAGDTTSRLKPWSLKTKYDNPLSLLLDVMNNPKAPGGLRIQCAKDAMPYVHARKEGTKKEEAEAAAKKTAAKSRFSGQAAPLRRVS